MLIDDKIKLRKASDSAFYESGDNCCLEIFKNSDFDEYKSYIEKLKNEGFYVLQETDNGGNIYTSLKKDVQINAYFTPSDSTVRVTYEENNYTACLKKADFTNDGETIFYCFENDQTLIDCGMCLIVQCPDNSFFLVDSGHYLQMNDNDRLHKFLRERTPEGQKIIINGWLITHSHTDHVSKMLDFLKYNCDDVIIEGFFTNLLSDNYEITGWDKEERAFNTKVKSAIRKQKNSFHHRLHSGERLFIRNLVFDVMCTHEDIHPEKIENFNDTSIVTMLRAENTRIFIPGDAGEKEDKILISRFKESLKCDVAQISHHGHFGLSTKTYELLGAETVIFPVTRIKYDEEYNHLEANRRAVEIAKKCFISSDGTVKITLPYCEKSAEQLPDETFEDFEKIKRLWGYEYTEEYKKELYDLFLKNGGKLEENLLPVDYMGTFLM